MNRRVVIEAPAAFAKRQLLDAIDDARLGTAPPLVALHRATANMRRVKVLGASRSTPWSTTSLATDIWTCCSTVRDVVTEPLPGFAEGGVSGEGGR
ncbi:hypothetical protein AB0M87_19160 [Streptomyces sp. NPDC051320]|uniref:hypothetical protein n=1 Tax=Streptomyces sp. NPDC051320 TaxID=3154644 RepID=UPI003433C681